MSAHFAIPATTFVLRSLIEARLKAAYGPFTPPAVSIEPPPRPPAPSNGAPPPEAAGLILYLYQAGPNAAWRNRCEPQVDSQGNRLAPAPLVLDLHYMLAAQGADLEREAVLGIGMSAFHRNGIVPRPMIQALLGAVPPPGSPTKLMDSLTAEPLGDKTEQPEAITIVQQSLDLDQATKLWSALQSPLRPSAFYLVTTVLLHGNEVAEPAEPVEQVVIAARPTADASAAALDDAVAVVTEPAP